MKKIVFVFLLVAIFCGCSDSSEQNGINLEGTFTGTFTVDYSGGTQFSGDVTVIFSDKNKYQCSGNGNNNDFYPAGGNGTYEMDESKILFSDGNIWLAHFDWNLILNGAYDYEMNGNQLIVSAYKNNVGFYKYELVKQ